MEECIFCKIIRGEIPSQKLYEDDDFLAFLDINPISDGHTLVIPKKHVENMLEFPEELGDKAVKVLKKVSSAAVKAMGADGFNIGMNNKKAAGQLVMHAHFHVIPRFGGDGLEHWPGRRVESGKLDDWMEKIKKEI